MKDLIIGAIDNYTWDKVNNWAISIRDSGYEGDIALLVYRADQNVIDNAKKLNIDVYQIDYDPFGNPINHNAGGRDTQCHQMRFFHAWQLLEQLRSTRYVVMTDVRDVIFQKNPIEFMETRKETPDLIQSSEHIHYDKEIWNWDNLLNGFGPIIADGLRGTHVHNVGVLAGTSYHMSRLFFTIFTMTQGRYIPSDQSAYNVIIRNSLFPPAHEYSDWAAQCGVTLDPQKAHYKAIIEPRNIPVVRDGLVYDSNGQLFVMVHQYDRVPGLVDKINSRYA